MQIDNLLPYLEGYNQNEINFLHSGFTQGFDVGFEGPQLSYVAENSKKIKMAPEVAERKINQELIAGRISGPYDHPPLPNFRVSPLSIRPKKQVGHFRLLHDLSFPYDNTSTNAGIPENIKSVHYTRLSDAMETIVKLGKNCYLAKTDISSAFRIIPLARKNYNLMGFRWNSAYYYDMCLPQGLGTSCAIFEKFSTALHWVAEHKLHIPHMHHILDDFLIAATTYTECKHQLTSFLQFCAHIGVPMAPEKTFGPSLSLPFLGINLSSVTMLATLPQDKLDECRQDINHLLEQKRGTLKKIQSVNGKLNFACSVVLPGRAFLRRLSALTAGLQKPHHTRHLNKDIQEDLKMWLFFLEHYNGKTFFLQQLLDSNGGLNLCSDASKLGFGCTYKNQWVQCTWPEEWTKNYDINFLELYAILVALTVWGSHLKNSTVRFYCDNLPSVEILRKQSSDSPLMMCLVRHIVLTCMVHNILLAPRHIVGVNNILCDRISRFKCNSSLLQEYGMNQSPVPIPAHLLPANYKLNNYNYLKAVLVVQQCQPTEQPGGT